MRRDQAFLDVGGSTSYNFISVTLPEPKHPLAEETQCLVSDYSRLRFLSRSQTQPAPSANMPLSLRVLIATRCSNDNHTTMLLPGSVPIHECPFLDPFDRVPPPQHYQCNPHSESLEHVQTPLVDERVAVRPHAELDNAKHGPDQDEAAGDPGGHDNFPDERIEAGGVG